MAYRFTSVPGHNDPESISTPGHISPGLVSASLLATHVESATLTPTGILLPSLLNQLLYSGAASFITQLRTLIFKVVKRTTSQYATQPESVDVSVSNELFPAQIDFTYYITSPETVTVSAVQLLLSSTNGAISSSWQAGTISVSGNVVQVPIDCTKLSVGQSYQLLVTVTLNTNKKLTAALIVNAGI